MNISLLHKITTPCYISSLSAISRNAERIRRTAENSDCTLLFAMKSLNTYCQLSSIATYCNGFATSSLFEAKYARKIFRSSGVIHFTTPGICPAEILEIAGLCDYISFNSISQLAQFSNAINNSAFYGLRVNPQKSFIEDERYDPARHTSKLGVPLNDLCAMLSNGARDNLEGITGIHFHNNADSTDFSQLLQTVEHLDLHLGNWLSTLDWVNLGGGYLFPEDVNLRPFYEAVDLLKSKHGLTVFIEPGAAIVRDAGFIVSSVVDLFKSDGKQIAVLDTTVNHMPEVFEYQYEPDVLDHSEGGEHSYILAGASCLAGDLFGEYSFEEPLELGSKVVFTGMGAYTLVKAHMFNGINLPTVYSLTEDGELILEKKFTYEDFTSRNGLEKHDHA